MPKQFTVLEIKALEKGCVCDLCSMDKSFCSGDIENCTLNYMEYGCIPLHRPE